MHVGLFAKRRFAVAKALAVLTISALTAAELPAQTPQAAQGNAGAGPMQALYLSAAGNSMLGGQQSPYMDAYGNPVVVPVNFSQPCGPGGACYPGPGYPGPCAMGCGGTDPPVGCDLAADVGDGGYGTDQRGPHYFDVRAEAVNLTRKDSFARHIDFTSFNITDNDIVLSSDQLDIDSASGFRILGRYDICPLAVLEFGYMRMFEWDAGASFTDPQPVDADTGNLYSLYSQFGTNPATVTLPGGPMPESERSITQRISLDVDLQTAEISYRRYWVGFIPRISGTLLAGFRYTQLKEEFEFSSQGEAALDSTTVAENNLAGFQTGGDIWISLCQGLRAGSEGKVGLYNNHYTMGNKIVSTPVAGTPPDLIEQFHKNQPALIGEASADLVADILPSWSLRAGYEVLYLNSLVLAGENFNTASPYGLGGQDPRVPFVFDQGHAYMHGFHAGVEFIW